MTDYSPEFETFWKAYPKRGGQKRGKLPSFKVWQKMSASEKRVAQSDVEKRNRLRGWGKHIKDPERYLKHKCWEDDWDAYSPDDDAKPNSGPYVPPPKHDEPQMHWIERMLGRLFRNYCMLAGGLGEKGDKHASDKALAIKKEMMRDIVPSFDEEIEQQTMTKDAVAMEIAALFYHRLDLEYKQTLKDRALERILMR